MANEKISDMTDATLPLDGTELLPLVQGGANVKTPLSSIQFTERNLVTADFSFPYTYSNGHEKPVFLQIALAIISVGENTGIHYWFNDDSDNDFAFTNSGSSPVNFADSIFLLPGESVTFDFINAGDGGINRISEIF